MALMRLLTALLVTSVCCAASHATADEPSGAARLIREYGEIAIPDDDPRGDFRSRRLDALRKLKELPEGDVLPAVGAALANERDQRRRAELVETLRDFPSKASADLLVRSLADPSAHVRRNAVHILRLFSRKVDRIGGKREQRAAWANPKVEGLVPHLIKAADDPDETNRTSCLYALADTLDPTAVDRIRTALRDASDAVRMTAACMLSEFNDSSGIEELKAALPRVRAAPAHDAMRLMNAERIVTSMERLTGKSFGRLPMNPMLMSDSTKAADARREYDRVMSAWAAWWDWEPRK
jgi:HEAT repeat protein